MRYKYLKNVNYIFKVSLFVNRRNKKLDNETSYTYFEAR